MTATLLLLLKFSVGAIILAIGLSSTVGDLTYLWRRPGLLLRSLLAMYVLVPLVALLLVRVLELSPGVEIALLVLAISAGAPLLPRKLMPFGNDAYVFSLVVTSTLLAIVIVPAWLAVLGAQFGYTGELQPARIAMIFAKSFFLPLLIGMLLRWLLPAIAERVSDWLMGIAGALLTVCALALLVLNWEIFLEISGLGLLTLAVLLIIALAIGHLLGGPDEGDRSILAIACATRHLGIAILVAAALPGPRTAVLIAAYIVTAAVVSIPYLRWRRKQPASDPSSANS
jgi:BASS family bile acid:Na+ symporter